MAITWKRIAQEGSSPTFEGLTIGGPRLVGWPHRKLIALPIPTANLTDFPEKVPIVAGSPTSIAIGAHCLATGYDLRFTAIDGVTLLPYERESFAVVVGEATGIFWVKTDVAMAGTYIWCYYGNPAGTDVSSGPDVFDTEAAVYHMNDGEDTSHIHDSSANAAHGTKKGAGEPAEVDAKIAKGQNFDGADDYIHSTPAINGFTSIRLAAWVNIDTLVTWTVISVGAPGAGMWRMDISDGGALIADFWTDGNAASADYLITVAGGWYRLCMTFDGTTKRAYINGIQVATATSGATAVAGSHAHIGALWSVDRFVDGQIDEVSISSVIPSADWEKYEYDNQVAADGGLTWGAEEELNLEVDADANVSGVYRVDGVRVIGERQAAIADADAGTLLAQFNTLLAEIRIHGLIDV